MSKLNDGSMTSYSKLNNEFFSMMCKENPDKKMVFSTFSFFVLLSILANATDGQTREEILRVLECESIDEVNKGVTSLIKEICSKKDSKFISSNGICIRDDLYNYVSEDFSEFMKKKYGVQIFRGNSNCVKKINEWVSKNTDGMISGIYDNLPANFVMTIMNAIAFDARWKNRYESEDITEGTFYNSDQTESEVNMLFSEEKIYLEDDNFKGFAKYYKGGDYAFVALLPKDDEREIFKKNLKELDIVSMYKNRKSIEVDVEIPEFEIETDKDITLLCKELGIKQIFDSVADFSGILKEHELMVDSIIQKAKIKVDRDGTKAAAITYVDCVEGAAIMEREYICFDRSFVYSIIHTGSGLPVFSGIVNKL